MSRTIPSFISEGWEPMTVPAGTTETVEIMFNPLLRAFTLLPQAYGPDGVELGGEFAPTMTPAPTAAGVAIRFATPTTERMTVLYRVDAREFTPGDVAPEDSA